MDNVGNSWASRPPENTEGALVDLSDRPIMCAATNLPSASSGEMVYGCSDHALYAIPTDRFASLREGDRELQASLKPVKLHSKQYGHRDWVTSVSYTLDGLVVSGGMDGYLCHWSRDKRRCKTMTHHTRSISGVYSVGGSNAIVSSSYDCSVAVWDFRDTGDTIRERRRGVSAAREVSGGDQLPLLDLRGHKSPVIQVAVNTATLASGGKDGGLLIWDLPSGQQLARVRGHDNAPCSCLLMRDDSSILVSAGGDGRIKLWDPRLKRLLCSQTSTPSNSSSLSSQRHEQGQHGGAITNLSFLESNSYYFASATSSGEVSIHDIRWNASSSASTEGGKSTCNFSLVSSFNEAIGGIHCLTSLSSSCIAVGDGAGMLIVYDAIQNRLCYGLSSSGGGPIKTVTPSRRDGRNILTTGGEDGSVLFYKY